MSGQTEFSRTYVTVFRKTNRSARKLIIAYARIYAFEHKNANVNKEKEVCFTHRRNVVLASNLDGHICMYILFSPENSQYPAATPALSVQEHQYISTSVHMHISTSVHQYICTSVHQYISTYAHQYISMSVRSTSVRTSIVITKGHIRIIEC